MLSGVFGELDYVTPEDLALIPVLGSRPEYVVYAPLAETPFPPDVVLLFVNANQTLILSEAPGKWKTRMPPPWAGRHARRSPGHEYRPCGVKFGLLRGAGLPRHTHRRCRCFRDSRSQTRGIHAADPGLGQGECVLSKFHQIRRHAIAAGATPTIKESLAALAP